MAILLAVFNSDAGRLARAVDSLAAQDLDKREWEFVIVDNNSTRPIDWEGLNLDRFPAARRVVERRQGLLHARVRGIRETAAPIILFCDDDGILDPSYLSLLVELFDRNPRLGNASGVVKLEYERAPPDWVAEFADKLAGKDHGASEQRADWTGSRSYPVFAGGGIGAAFRRVALAPFLDRYDRGDTGPSGRSGAALTSSEDNHIVICVLEAGWEAGYFPALGVRHVIPASRLEQRYLGRLSEGIARSWVEVLDLHGICPWSPAAPWTMPLRRTRAFLRHRPWRSPAAYVRWREALGYLAGRAAIWRRAHE